MTAAAKRESSASTASVGGGSSDPAGRLVIRIDAATAAVSIRSTRALSAARVFAGKSPDEVVRQLPMLFSLCGTAQAAACVGACEQALGLTAIDASRRWRQRLVQAETVKEHLWRLLVDWPRALAPAAARHGPADAGQLDPASPGSAYPRPLMPVMAQVMQSFVRARQRVLSEVDPFRLEQSGSLTTFAGPSAPSAPVEVAPSVQTELAAALEDLSSLAYEHALRIPPADWLASVDSTEALMRWAQQAATTPAQLVQVLLAEGLAGCGANPVPRLADLPVANLAQRLAGPDSEAFIAAPQWQERCWETGPLGRAARHPLVAALIADFGNGLLAHLAALLVELAESAAALASLELGSRIRESAPAGAVSDQQVAPGVPAAEAAAAAGRSFDAERAVDADAGVGAVAHTQPAGEAEAATGAEIGIGIAHAEAARGALLHRVEIAGGMVQHYQILAPTEWNFHPAGVVAQGLERIAQSGVGEVEIERLARLYITAVDPCVEYHLSVS